MRTVHITTDGIVLRERAVEEYDSVLTLLTKERGVITAYARGAKKPRGVLRVPGELLSYSCFVLFENKGKYSVDKADLNSLFMGVRGDVEKLSLASYFCQLTAELAPHEEPALDYLRLLLNSLYLLDRGKRSCGFVKAVYELRLMTMAGYMPNLVACTGCGCFESDVVYFLPQSASIACGACIQNYPENQIRVPLSRTVLAAMRHILYAKSEKLFSFTAPKEQLMDLNEITQHYVMTQIEKRLETLDFYLSMQI
ncbi:MAG: DNA repair protein RecO [Anaerotruncus sp.]|nr:DNA repair protein RecO [Anaerotruncus sp.]MCI9234434.1 DNA repair protein RecO [Anaerotruncus sp.]